MKSKLWVFFVVAVLWPTVAMAWDPFPVLAKGSHYAGSGPWQKDAKLESCLAELSARSDANYYASIVNNTSATSVPTDNDAVPFVDGLSRAWSNQLRPDKDVLIVMGVTSRSVAIHPGSEWVRMGFENRVIAQTIDSSQFGSHARSGDYGGGICQLATAVEQKLKMLAQREQNFLAQTRAQVPTLRARVAALHKRVDKEIRDPAVRQAFSKRVSASDAIIDELNFLLGQQNVAGVEGTLDALQKHFGAIDDTFKAIAAIGPKASDVRNRTQQMVGRIESGPYSNDKKKALVAEANKCPTLIPTAAEVAAGRSDFDRANMCLSSLSDKHDSAVTGWQFTHRVVPAAGGTGLGFGLLFAGGIFGLRRRSAKRLAQTQIDTWDQKLDTAGERLLDLESRFAGYLSTPDVRYVGDTETLDKQAAEAVNMVFLMYDQATLLLKEARAMFADVSPASAKGFEHCIDKLTRTPVTFELGIPEKELRIFLPLTQSYTGTATSVMNDLESRYEVAAKLLERLQNEVDRAMASSASVRELLGQADDAVDARSQLGFPVTGHLEALEKLEAEFEDFSQLVISDPVSANRSAKELSERVDGFRSRIEDGNQIMRRLAEDVTPAAKALRETIREKRASGWALKEPGFDPEAMLDEASLVARAMKEALASYREVEAQRLFGELESMVSLAADRVSVTLAAREDVPQRREALSRRREWISTEIPGAKRTLERLSQSHSLEAYAVESDNLDELSGVLVNVDTYLARIGELYQQERYLAATADLAACENAIGSGEVLIREIGQVLTRLEELKASAKGLRAQCLERVAEIEPLLDKPGVGEARRVRFAEAKSGLNGILARMEGERPNWVSLSAEVSSTLRTLESLSTSIKNARSAFELAVEEMSEIRPRLATLAAEVQRETRDRPHVQQAVDAAQAEIARIEAGIPTQDWEGEHVLDLVTGIESMVSQAQASWETERSLIEQATREVARAKNAFNRIGTQYYGLGITPNLASAKRLWLDAEDAVKVRDWANAYTLAQRSFLETQRQDAACRREAEDARQRRRLATVAATAHTSNNWSRSSSSSYTSSSSSSFRSSSSSSSSSGGSSFGGSSSGGSSW
ncbi:MAG: hypothetical protein R3E66_02175 [bacterium]